MKTMLAASICTLSLAGCGTSSPATAFTGAVEGAIEVRPRGYGPVSRTAFTCTEHPPEVLTPCYEGPTRIHGTWSDSPAPGIVELALARSSNQVDGGSVSANIVLQFSTRGELAAASARQEAAFELGLYEPLIALGGWIRPVATSPTLQGRNAGTFSIDFEWGTVAGTYDSDDRGAHGE